MLNLSSRETRSPRFAAVAATAACEDDCELQPEASAAAERGIRENGKGSATSDGS